MEQGGGRENWPAGCRDEARGGPAGGEPDQSVGLYIHVPWCQSICTYCDFDRQAHAFELIPAYVAALAEDARRQPVVAVHSIFFGGGTPSLLGPAQIRTVLDACQERFRLAAGAEVTVEANPGDLDAGRVAAYLAAGVNRLSLGIQSFDDRLLRLLGRRHTALEAEQAFRQARAGGAANISLDLMYGLPGQSAAHWRATLERALRLEPDHLSAYLLTIDERVPLGRQVARGQVLLPPDDELAEMYASAQALLPAAGLEQYEISNWAKPGRASRHNLTYWRDEPYLALGAGAAGSFGGRRYKHTPSPAGYIAAVAAGRSDLLEDETTDPRTAAQDHLALGLRLREGLDLERFRRRFGYSLLEASQPVATDLLAAGLLERRAGRLRIAADHLLVSNEIILRLHEALARRAGGAVGVRPGAS
jgi:oxygen-independent coproporphyrinogen-3 oxidase